MSENEEKTIVTLVGDDDEIFDAELIDSISYDDRIYCLFVPVEEADSEEEEVIILEYVEDGDDITFLPIENEVLLDEIWDAYNAEDIEEEQ